MIIMMSYLTEPMGTLLLGSGQRVDDDVTTEFQCLVQGYIHMKPGGTRS